MAVYSAYTAFYRNNKYHGVTLDETTLLSLIQPLFKKSFKNIFTLKSAIVIWRRNLIRDRWMNQWTD